MVLLGEHADGGGRGIEPDHAGVRFDRAGQDAEQGRLADAVGAEHADAGPGGYRERHVVEHEAVASGDREVLGDQGR